MTPQAGAFVDKGRQSLVEAEQIFSIGLFDSAGRLAYLSAFHVAQAVIFEDRRKVVKTHHGVHTEFARLVKDDKELHQSLRDFLAKTYDLKQKADYVVGPEAVVSADDARIAIDTGRRFFEYFVPKLQRTSQ